MWKWNPEPFDYLLKKHGAEELSKKIGVTKRTLYLWKSGKLTPSIQKLLKIASAFDINPASFFDIKEVEDCEVSLSSQPIIAEQDKETVFITEDKKKMFSHCLRGNTLILKVFFQDKSSYGGFAVRETIKIRI